MNKLLTFLFLISVNITLFSQINLDSIQIYFDSIYLSSVYPNSFKPKKDNNLNQPASIQMDYLKSEKNLFLSHTHKDIKYCEVYNRFKETVNKNKSFEDCYTEFSEVLCRVKNYQLMSNLQIANHILNSFMKSPSHKKAISSFKTKYLFLFDYSVDNDIICLGLVANK
jgi:hypothetical protein